MNIVQQKNERIYHINPLPNPLLYKGEGTSFVNQCLSQLDLRNKSSETTHIENESF